MRVWYWWCQVNWRWGVAERILMAHASLCPHVIIINEGKSIHTSPRGGGWVGGGPRGYFVCEMMVIPFAAILIRICSMSLIFPRGMRIRTPPLLDLRMWLTGIVWRLTFLAIFYSNNYLFILATCDKYPDIKFCTHSEKAYRRMASALYTCRCIYMCKLGPLWPKQNEYSTIRHAYMMYPFGWLWLFDNRK